MEELSRLSKSTLLRLFRLYYLDFIIFDIKLDLLKTVIESKDKRPEAELFRRKERRFYDIEVVLIILINDVR